VGYGNTHLGPGKGMPGYNVPGRCLHAYLWVMAREGLAAEIEVWSRRDDLWVCGRRALGVGESLLEDW
jgi:hypothetical protein